MKKTKILIVEDENVAAGRLQKSLDQMGYTVTSTVPSGEQAIKKVKEENPDIVLMDIVLEGKIDGIETAKIIQSGFDIPVIYFTAHEDETILERAKETEPFGYIIKPFKDKELKRVIDIALYKHKVEKERRKHVQRLSKEVTGYKHVEGKLIDAYKELRAIQQASVHIMKDLEEEIAERKRVEKELKALNESLEQRVKERTKNLEESNEELQKEINVRKLAEEALKESELKYRKLVESANDAIFLADAETGIILEANRQSEYLIGIPAEKIVGMHQAQLHPKEEAEYYKRVFSECVQKGRGITGDLFVCHKNGSRIPVEISGSVTELGGKKVIQGIFRDITERRKAEKRLRENEERLQAIIDNTTAVIYLKDIQGRYILINKQYEKLFHITRYEIIGKTDYDIFPEERASAFLKNDRKVLEAEAPIEFEEIAPHDDGLHTYISIKFPLSTPEDIIYGVCGISTDITERKRMEEELKRTVGKRDK